MNGTNQVADGDGVADEAGGNDEIEVSDVELLATI